MTLHLTILKTKATLLLIVKQALQVNFGLAKGSDQRANQRAANKEAIKPARNAFARAL
jgi:hypothetical protein